MSHIAFNGSALARAVSILGHPLLMLPLAVLALSLARNGGDRDTLVIAAGFGMFAAAVLGYSWWQVRCGRWTHVDASTRHERGSLNRFLLVALAVAAVVAWSASMHELAFGLGLSAALIAAAMLSSRYCKLSLHLAFAVYAAMLLSRIDWRLAAGAFVFAAVLAWSRLALQRHVPRDLVAGALAGLIAGALFWQLLPAVALPAMTE
ncbi:MAG: phosphatase PAP2 family protein [Pseudomonadota bacterium]|nr:phosphatase PAP2 family protein [Pseudomonadota bacterium]